MSPVKYESSKGLCSLLLLMLFCALSFETSLITSLPMRGSPFMRAKSVLRAIEFFQLQKIFQLLFFWWYRIDLYKWALQDQCLNLSVAFQSFYCSEWISPLSLFVLFLLSSRNSSASWVTICTENLCEYRHWNNRTRNTSKVASICCSSSSIYGNWMWHHLR